MSSPGELASELLRIVAGLRRVTRRRLAADLGFPPLPGAPRELLFVVEAHPGIGVAAAAAELGLAGNSVSTLVNSLAQAGLLRRDVDPADRRAARLTLTPAARERLDAWRGARSALMTQAMERAGTPAQEAIEAALPALDQVLTHLRYGPDSQSELPSTSDR